MGKLKGNKQEANEQMMKEFIEYMNNKGGDADNDYEVVKTMTKVWTNRLLWFSCLWVTWSYALATIGKEEIADNLSIKVVIVILGTFIPYLIRGFLDTYCMKKQQFRKKQMEISKELYNANDMNVNMNGNMNDYDLENLGKQDSEIAG